MSSDNFDQMVVLLNNICPIRPADRTASQKLDETTPSFIAEPQSAEEVAKILKFVVKQNMTAAIAGGQSKFAQGCPLTSVDCLISSKQLDNEPIIQVDDLVIRVQAGVSIEKLQKRLKDEGLYLPVEDGHPEATVGGIIACGDSMELRDALLGIQVALLDGKVYNFGRQTVKNVAGYDMGKLFLGSKGTLGIITEAWLRVYPLPKVTRIISGHLTSDIELWPMLSEIKKTQPQSVELIVTAKGENLLGRDDRLHETVLLLKYSGQELAVEQQYNEALAVINKYGVVIDGEKAEEAGLFWHRKIQRTAEINPDIIRLMIKTSPSKLGSIHHALGNTSSDSNVESIYWPLIGKAEFTFPMAGFQGPMEIISDAAHKNHSKITIIKGPVSYRQRYCNREMSSWDLKIKEFFDPKNILNPGKMP